MFKENFQPMDIDKGKQREGIVQDEDMLLYKLYNISSEHNQLKTSSPVFVQEEIANLEKALKTLQLPVKTIPSTVTL